MKVVYLTLAKMIAVVFKGNAGFIVLLYFSLHVSICRKHSLYIRSLPAFSDPM